MSPLRSVALAMLVLAGAALLGAGCQPAGPVVTSPPGAVVVSAIGSVFEQRPVVAPDGEAFTLWFNNREGTPHNARLANAAGETLADTLVFAGPAGRPAEVEPLPAGTYTLICDVHPGMTTELVAQ